MLSSGVFPTYPRGEENHIVLLIIDPQNDFHDGGSLAVKGATEDARRIASMIRRETANIGQIFVTMDSHNRNHIAHSSFWFSEKASSNTNPNEERLKKRALKSYATSSIELFEPAPKTIITSDDIGRGNTGKWEPVDHSLLEYCQQYAKTLKLSRNHFDLCIWPEHCIVGTSGHSVQDDIYEATQHWQRDWQRERLMYASSTQSIPPMFRTVNYIYKGNNNLTEMYSAIRAEVPVMADPSTQTNEELLAYLFQASKVVVCGQALSHCVNFTVRDIVDDWIERGKDTRRLVLLTDGMSSVGTFEKAGDKFLLDMRDKGVTLSTTLDRSVWR